MRTSSTTVAFTHAYVLQIFTLLSSFVYVAAMSMDAAPHLRALLKVVPIFLMLLLTLIVGHMNRYACRTAFGLACCALGDVSLELEGGRQAAKSGASPLFLIGLICFFFGHAAYACAFAVNRMNFAPLTVVPPLSCAGAIFYVLKPSLPAPMILPVLAYATVIAVMLTLALSRHPQRRGAQWSSRCSESLSMRVWESSSWISAFWELNV